MKVLKLQRQLKVYEDLIAQHRKNIDKIEKAEEKIKWWFIFVRTYTFQGPCLVFIKGSQYQQSWIEAETITAGGIPNARAKLLLPTWWQTFLFPSLPSLSPRFPRFLLLSSGRPRPRGSWLKTTLKGRRSWRSWDCSHEGGGGTRLKKAGSGRA